MAYMFGREMKTFEDVATEQEEDGEDVQDSYDKRTYELKKLLGDIQSTLENIEESQLNQKHYQNNRMYKTTRYPLEHVWQ